MAKKPLVVISGRIQELPTSGESLEVHRNGITTTFSDGISIENRTAATSGVKDQYSPNLRFEAHYWNGSADVKQEFVQAVITSNAEPIRPSSLVWRYASGGGAFSELMRLTSGGLLGINNPIPLAALDIVAPLGANGLFLSGTQPTDVGTTPGTAGGSPISIQSAPGGNTTIATTGVGGIGGPIIFNAGTGGVANSALTSGTGGTGGTVTIKGGAGGTPSISGGALATGGAGGNTTVQAGTGGSGLLATTKNGGAGGSLILNGGQGGTGATSDGVGGPIIFKTAATISLAEVGRFDAAGNFTANNIIKAGSTPVALNNSVGYLVAAAMEAEVIIQQRVFS